MGKVILSAVVAIVFGFLVPTASAAGLFDKFKEDLNKATDEVTSGGSDSSGSSSALSLDQITEGLLEALKVGTETVVGQIGAADGYNGDPDIHIPLPDQMQQAQSWLRKFGLSGMADEVEEKLNRGAEAAAPKTKEIIWNAIAAMTMEDAKAIYDGPDDAATQYFRKVSTADLTETVRPIIDQSLHDVGAIAAYDNLLGEYQKYPLVPDIKSDLTAHATDLALEGLFHYLAIEEANIRNNPVARTTDILKNVFGI